MSQQHTPGPWSWTQQYRGSDGQPAWSLLGDNGYGILSCDAANAPQDLGARGLADASIVAAAPDLLAYAECEAAMELPLNEAYAVLERHGWRREMRVELPILTFLYNMRAAAIAKATGAA